MNASDDWKPSYFSLQRRCQGCGTKLSEPPPEMCPHCHRSLQDVGIWSQFTEWEQQRKQGRWRFVLRDSLWVVLIVVGALVVRHFLRHDLHLFSTWIVTGSFFALGIWSTFFRWRSAESDYAEWKKRQP